MRDTAKAAGPYAMAINDFVIPSDGGRRCKYAKSSLKAAVWRPSVFVPDWRKLRRCWPCDDACV